MRTNCALRSESGEKGIPTKSSRSMTITVIAMPTGNERPIFSERENLGEIVLMEKNPNIMDKKIPK